MPTYAAPLTDMRFLLERVIGLDTLYGRAGYETLDGDLVNSVLEEAGRFASEIMAPLNQIGDKHHSHLDHGIVKTPPGFKSAYQAFVDNGWNAVPFDPAFGGQGLPRCLSFAVQEMWNSANMGLGICPILTQGAVEAIAHHGSDAQKNLYLEKLISGAWTGTMNLTEPQAGSDLAAIRTKAVRDGDRYRLFGQKIFITYGDHDFTPNIIHMVLARLEGAPAGVKGISLFLAPKILVNDDGSLGEANDLRCVSLEHKLGIHASPTAIISYGDHDGAIAYLIGEENHGLEYMFTMMNSARLSVGVQGLAIAERSYQQARDYANARVQGKTFSGTPTIIGHPDVKRMLLHMKTEIEAMRALTYLAGFHLDLANAGSADAQARVDLLTPVIKSWATDSGVEIASLGIQVHGGMGYIEETGAAQYLRDARILPIYEGANGIQANDLMFRKTLRDQGYAALAFVAEMRAFAAELKGEAAFIAAPLHEGLLTLQTTIEWIVAKGGDAPAEIACGASAYLRLFALVAGGYMIARILKTALEDLSADKGDASFLKAKLPLARYYAQIFLPEASALGLTARTAHDSVLAFPDEQF